MSLKVYFCFYFLICQSIALIQVASFLKSSTEKKLLRTLWLYHNLTKVLITTKEREDYIDLFFVDYKLSSEIPDKMCAMIESSARQGNTLIAIFGSSQEPSAMVVESAACELQMPFISLISKPNAKMQNYRKRLDGFLPDLSIDLWHRKVDVGNVVSNLIDQQKNSQVLVVYNGPEDLFSLQNYLKNCYKPFGQRKTYFRVYANNGDNRPLIKEALVRWEINFFVLHLNLNQTREFMEQVDELGGCTNEKTYIFMTMDAIGEDVTHFKAGLCNLTVINWIDVENHQIWKLRHFLIHNGFRNFLPSFGVTTKMAIWSDSIATFASTIHENQIIQQGKMLNQNNPSCQKLPLFVRDFRNHLISTKLTDQTTGNLSFYKNGQRKDYQFFVYESSKGKPWEKEEPFVMIHPEAKTLNLTGNDQYDGYCIDLLEKIAELRNFTYEIHEVYDKTYGVKESNGKWTGMVGELQSGLADLAVASLTVTYTRSEVLDFTVPYMHLGISILFKRPKASSPSFFHFLAPLSYDVWLWALGAYIGASIFIWMLAKMSPIECKKDEPNRLTLSNSFWFTVSSLMQQGPEICPSSASTRIATVFWWFFALIFISSYTANLAAFLTTERMITPIENADDLAKQTKIKYGTLGRGSTMTFFNESKIETYEKMWKLMESQPSLFVKSSKEGIERVKKGDYAYLMESSMLEYAIERDCDLLQIGGLLDQKGYAIGLPKGSPHRELISTAILELQEKTVLTELKDKWWKKQRGGGVCQHAKLNPSEYGAKSVAGIFIVLICGLALSISVAIIQLLIEAQKISKKKSSPLSVELWRMITISWNESRGKDDRIKRTIDDLIEYKDGLPVPHFSNPIASEIL